MPAGELRYRLDFQKHGDADDGFGGTIPGAGPFETQFTAATFLKPLHGGEEVMAGRLAGTQTFLCRVQSSAASRQITPAWRAVDARAGVDTNGDPKIIYQIKSPPSDPDGKRVWIEMIVEIGTTA